MRECAYHKIAKSSNGRVDDDDALPGSQRGDGIEIDLLFQRDRATWRGVRDSTVD